MKHHYGRRHLTEPTLGRAPQLAGPSQINGNLGQESQMSLRPPASWAADLAWRLAERKIPLSAWEREWGRGGGSEWSKEERDRGEGIWISESGARDGDIRRDGEIPPLRDGACLLTARAPLAGSLALRGTGCRRQDGRHSGRNDGGLPVATVFRSSEMGALLAREPRGSGWKLAERSTAFRVGPENAVMESADPRD
jgi:hypothetical protein